MAEQALNPTIVTPASGEGQDALDMGDLRDIRLLNNQFVQFGIRNLARVERYLVKLDKVMDETQDERITVAGASVAVNALKAAASAIKKEVAGVINNMQVNVSNGLDLSKLTLEQLKALAGE